IIRLKNNEVTKMIDRREFLVNGSAAAASMMLANKTFGGSADIQLEEATVVGLQSAMASGQATARKIAEAYLTRIADVDKKLNSVIELNPDALAIADQMDRERKGGKVRGTLHGIPVL